MSVFQLAGENCDFRIAIRDSCRTRLFDQVFSKSAIRPDGPFGQFGARFPSRRGMTHLAAPMCDVAAFPRAFRSSARMGYVRADQPYAALFHVPPCSATNLDVSSGVLARNCNV